MNKQLKKNPGKSDLMRKEKTQLNKMRNEKREITTNTKEIQGIIWGITLKTCIQINWKI
jgi:hypothetical protein